MVADSGEGLPWMLEVCVCVWGGVDRGGSWELTEKREMLFSVKRLLTTEQAALVP